MKCTAKNSRPAPSFVWTVDEVTLDHKTENMFDEESAVFTQILHFVPGLEHANKTLRCSVKHPGLEKDISAGTEVRLSGEGPVSMMGTLTWELEGIIIAVLVLLFVAGMVFILRKKCASKSEDLKKPVDEEKGDDDENKPSEGEKKEVEAETKLEVSTVEEKKGFEIRSKVVKILANLKPKEKKMTEEVVASEFEKVELTEDAEEKKDGEKEASESQGFGSKLASFMSKFKPADKPPVDQTETEKTETKTDAESDDQDKEVDLNPEKPAEQVLNRRRGSETPV